MQWRIASIPAGGYVTTGLQKKLNRRREIAGRRIVQRRVAYAVARVWIRAGF